MFWVRMLAICAHLLGADWFCCSEILCPSAGYSPPPDQHQIQVPQVPKAISASRPKPRPQMHTMPMNGAPPRPPSAPSQAAAAAIAAAAAVPSPWAEKRRVLQVQSIPKFAGYPSMCASTCNVLRIFARRVVLVHHPKICRVSVHVCVDMLCIADFHCMNF
jgi:hypothetical protein